MSSILEPITTKVGERSNWEILAFLRFFFALIAAVTHLAEFTSGVGLLHWIADLGSFEAILGFLLISGYSIGNSIQKKSQGFLLRRMFRIYPVYLAAMALTYVIHREPLNGSFAWVMLVNLLFLSQIVVKTSYVSAAWSLALEIWLYCLAPVLIRVRVRSLEFLMTASFLCYVFYTCGRTLFHWPYYDGTLYGINLPCLAFIWIAGLYLTVSPPDKSRAMKIIGLMFLGHLFLSLAIQVGYRFKHHDLHDLLFIDLRDFVLHGALLGLICFIFSGIFAHRFHLNLITRRIFRFLGDISYPLYLMHIPTFILLATHTHNAVLLLLGAMASSTLVYLCCDFYSFRRKLG